MMGLSEFIKNFWQRVDFKVSYVTVVEFLLVLLIFPLIKYANPVWFVENSVVENLQLFILSAAFLICLKAKFAKKFFVFCGLIVILMIMRETNLGRPYLCAKYLAPNEVCKWKSFQYGYIVEWARILYVIGILIYAWKHKIWQPLWKYIISAPIYIWDILILLVCAVLGTVAEFQSVDNEILEECAETLMYVALAYCLWRYSRYNVWIK